MNGKKYLIVLVVLVSLANGYWASLTQGGNGRPEGSPVLLSMLSVWACYFTITWLFTGMRSK
jgi:ABC-type transporter Mla maintaining outer membrane lipid asymmetry permease subunit MlaE